jgi:hypothetical protein
MANGKLAAPGVNAANNTAADRKKQALAEREISRSFFWEVYAGMWGPNGLLFGRFQVFSDVRTHTAQTERGRGFFIAILDRSRPYWANVRSGLPFSTMYVDIAALLPLPTFFAVWTVPAGTNKTSPGFSVTGGWPSS